MWFQPRILIAPQERSPGVRVAIPLAAFLAAFMLRESLGPWLGREMPFAFLLPAVFVSAWFGGVAAGLLASVASALIVWENFPALLRFNDASEAARLGLFTLNGFIVTGLCAGLHRLLRRLRASALEAARTIEAMAQNAPVLIWATDAAGRCHYVNQHWSSFTGETLPAGGAVERPGRIHPADVARHTAISKQAIAARRPYEVEYRLRRHDGDYRWFLEQAVPRHGERQAFEGYIGCCSDITESRKEREELAFISRLQSGLAESLDLDRCAELLAQSFLPRLADWCSIQLVDDHGELECVRIQHFERGAITGRAAEKLDRFAAGIARSGEPQLIQAGDPAVLDVVAFDGPHREKLGRLPFVSYLGIPLRARGRITGVLALATAESGRSLDVPAQRLVQKIAGLAALALENARLYRSARQALAAEEHALREMQRSERRFRFMWEANIFGIGTISRAGRILSANSALATLLGYTREEIASGRASLGERTPPAWRSVDERANLELQLTGRCTPFEKEFVRPDGSVVQVLVCGSLLPESEECMTFVLDLTARRHVEAEFERQQTLLHTIVDAMPAMVAYVDTQERVCLHNEKYRQWFEVAAEAIEGRTIRDLLGEPAYQRVAPYLHAALRGRNMRHETTLRTADRQRHLIASYRPHLDASGHVRGIVIHAYDITERKETEQALADALLRYRFLADAMPQMVWTSLPDGRLDYVNHRWLETTGMTELASLGRDGWLDAVHPDDRAATGELWQRALRDQGTFQHECRVRCGPSEEWRWHLVRALPRRDDQETLVQWVGSATDIDELRRAYAELAEARTRLKSHADELEARVRARTATLREANAELEAFTYSVSHDLRTPLQFVRGFAEAIRDDAGRSLSPENRDYLQRIIRAAARMDTIIQDLLGYSRLARAEMQLVPVPLHDILADVLAHHHAPIKQSSASVQLSPDLPAVMADRTGLFQALSNLISNALKFSRPDCAPSITLRAETKDGRVRLWVEDDGIGIDPRHHERIFQLFERLHSASEYPGTGIGLSLVRKAVTRMGGQCGVESAPNAGARFWIEFPAACPAPLLSHASP